MKFKKEKNTKTESFTNSVKEMQSTGKDLSSKIVNGIKILPKLPWDKLSKEHYLTLIITLIGSILIFLVFHFLIF